MGYVLRKARPGEEKTVYAMIADRVKWMSDNNIHQWNDTDYLEVYPLSYYRKNLDRLYVLENQDTGQIVSAAVLFNQDDRWNSNSDEPSFYVHNFVAPLNSHGAGKLFLHRVEELAEKEGLSYLRLDSADDNYKLASYYAKLGFEPCGSCIDGKYHGILRQKKIQR